MQSTFGKFIDALLLLERHKFFKLPRRFPVLEFTISMLLYLPIVEGGDALLELDVLLRNVNIPLDRLSTGEASPVPTSK